MDRPQGPERFAVRQPVGLRQLLAPAAAVAAPGVVDVTAADAAQCPAFQAALAGAAAA